MPKLCDSDCYLFTGLNDGIGQLCLKRLFYSRPDVLNISALGNLYFDLARIFFQRFSFHLHLSRG